MRARIIAAAVTLLVAVGCFASFSTSDTALAGQTVSAPSSTEPPRVEVGSKVLERSATKAPVEVDDLARTGSADATPLLLVGLALAGVGLVLIDFGQSPRRPARRTVDVRNATRRRCSELPRRVRR